MIRVRWPDGTAFVYNGATQIAWGQAVHTLSEGKDGARIAFIPAQANCVIEFVAPCRIEGTDGIDRAIQLVLGNLERMSFRDLKALKRGLSRFNARSGGFKPKEVK